MVRLPDIFYRDMILYLKTCERFELRAILVTETRQLEMLNHQETAAGDRRQKITGL